MMATDQLHFHRETSAASEFEVGWDGPWPPPEQLVVVVGAQTGSVAISDPTKDDNAELIEKMRELNAEIRPYYLFSYSCLPEAVREHPHIFRGAIYVIKEES